MRRGSFVSSFAIAIMFYSLYSTNAFSCQRGIDALVSTDWLASNLNTGLVIVDLRSADAYAAGHIESAVNSPIVTWWVSSDSLMLELPEEAALRSMIGGLGIDIRTHVVLTSSAADNYDRAQTTRIAWTLIYSGIANVAILDGGYTKWIAEGRELSPVPVIPTVVAYIGAFKTAVLATKSCVMQNLFRGKIIDARLPEDFFGMATPRQFSEKDGHIAGAVNLPMPWVITSDGVYKDKEMLAEMARGVAGRPLPIRKTIVYCGVGGFASTWWFLLSEVLGYPNVSLYDGSIQEWTHDPKAPVEKYKW